MKRITINKSDDPSSIVEKLIDAKDDEIVLTIPRFAKFTDSLSNFHLVKREADILKKKIIIESVDDRVIELAGISGLDSINPFFSKYRRQISDIVVPDTSSSQSRRDHSRGAASADERDRPIKKRKTKSNFSISEMSIPGISFKTHRFIWWVGGIILLAVILISIFKFLPKADITIVTKHAEWSYKNSIVVDKNLALADISGNTIKLPGQLFIENKNLSLSFSASGKKDVEQKARGVILIYNAYSSDPQPLVINTRFETPDGKIYRLTKGITVAGAKIENGKIAPSSTEASVVADKAGPDYNIGPVERFTIPGFKGSPKFDAFYGQSIEPMKGGFVGELAYPTPGDIQKAKEVSAKQLEDSLKLTLAAQIPAEFKVLDGAIQFNLIKQDAGVEVNADGNFIVYSEGEVKTLAFKEQNLKDALFAKAIGIIKEDFINKENQLTYTGSAVPNNSVGQITFSIDFQGVFWPRIDIEKLKQDVAGKSESDLQTLVFALSNVESAKIALWPFWVSSVPINLNKIRVVIE
ncbi:MAG: hypothetical protein Q8Q37_00265 [bacterium]|nr:hypothetical protein [bacterium]